MARRRLRPAMLSLVFFAVVIPAIIDAIASSSRDAALTAAERDEAEQMIREWLATRR